MSRSSGKIRLANASDDLRPCSGLRLTCAPITRSHTWRQSSGRATPTRWDLWKHEIPPPQNSEPPKKNSEPRSLGEPFSSFYRDTSEYAFCRNPIPYTGATAQAAGRRDLLLGNTSAHHSSALRIGATTGIFRRTPSRATRRQGSSSRAALLSSRQRLHTPQQILTHQCDTERTLTATKPCAMPPRMWTKRQKDTRKSRKKVKKQKKCFALCQSSANFAPVYSKKEVHDTPMCYSFRLPGFGRTDYLLDSHSAAFQHFRYAAAHVFPEGRLD